MYEGIPFRSAAWCGHWGGLVVIVCDNFVLFCFSIIIKNMVVLMFSSSILIRLLFIIVLYCILLLLVHTTILALATCLPILYDHQRLASQWSEKICNFDGCCFSKTSNCCMRAIDFWYKVQMTSQQRCFWIEIRAIPSLCNKFIIRLQSVN